MEYLFAHRLLILNPPLKTPIIATIMAKNLLWPFAALMKAKVQSAAILRGFGGFCWSFLC